MSDLKHQSLEQLQASRASCDQYIRRLKSTLSGQEERLKWIDKYIYERTPVEMTMAQVETALGHKVILL